MNDPKSRLGDPAPAEEAHAPHPPRSSDPGDAHDPSAQRRARIPRRRWLWLAMLGLALLGLGVPALFDTVTLDAEGFLHEPLFGLIPISLALLLLALVLVVLDIVLSRVARGRCRDSD